jgi:1,2-dihydroxy-3-keto-5-methylthiopentene dioxygenase
MAILRYPDDARRVENPDEIVRELRPLGIVYEQWEPTRPVAPDAPPETVLDVYAPDIDRLKREGGYVTADVIQVNPGTPGLEEMLRKFSREHRHDEDEVRFIIQGSGVFHIRPERGAVVAIQVEAGDLLRVPAGTQHWFDLCPDRRIRAIRLFKDPAGWVPRYTDSGVDRSYQPVCLGPAHVRA